MGRPIGQLNSQKILLLSLAAIIGLGALGGTVASAKVLMAQSPIAPAQSKPAQPDRIKPNWRQPKPQASAQSVNPELTSANSRFGFKLFQTMQQQDASRNLMISPTSIAMALDMVYNGASGPTQKAMDQALQLNGLDLTPLNQANRDLKAALESTDPQVQITLANSLWVKKDFSFKGDFWKASRESYRARLSTVDFAQPSAAKSMNDWVSRNTQGKIPQIVDRTNPDDVMFLLNALYFKGGWSRPFDKSETTDRDFHLSTRKTKPVPMMAQRGHYAYLETPQFQAVALPYGTGRFSLYVFLPKSDSSLTALSKELTATNWKTWMGQFSDRPGAIQLPRFKLEYGADLKPALSALGMGSAFDPIQAKFANLSDQPTFISQVKHKTFVEVNEVGTEAAAATSIVMTATSARIPEAPFQMVADRPFFCAIRDSQTDTLLFLGAIVDPG
jgi:serine protease inhibitor